MIYTGNIEKLTIDKKVKILLLIIFQKGIIKLSKYNLFLSKKERVQKIENVKDIEIIKKGIEQPGIDTTKYYIRITFNDNIYFDFGESVYLMTIHEKYKQCVAVIKEIVVPDMVSNDYNNEEEFNEN